MFDPLDFTFVHVYDVNIDSFHTGRHSVQQLQLHGDCAGALLESCLDVCVLCFRIVMAPLPPPFLAPFLAPFLPTFLPLFLALFLVLIPPVLTPFLATTVWDSVLLFICAETGDAVDSVVAAQFPDRYAIVLL